MLQLPLKLCHSAFCPKKFCSFSISLSHFFRRQTRRVRSQWVWMQWPQVWMIFFMMFIIFLRMVNFCGGWWSFFWGWSFSFMLKIWCGDNLGGLVNGDWSEPGQFKTIVMIFRCIFSRCIFSGCIFSGVFLEVYFFQGVFFFRCIPNKWKCDGDEDCIGGDDESHSICDAPRCLKKILWWGWWWSFENIIKYFKMILGLATRPSSHAPKEGIVSRAPGSVTPTRTVRMAPMRWGG